MFDLIIQGIFIGLAVVGSSFFVYAIYLLEVDKSEARKERRKKKPRKHKHARQKETRKAQQAN